MLLDIDVGKADLCVVDVVDVDRWVVGTIVEL
jgi:hypothetical protein